MSVEQSGSRPFLQALRETAAEARNGETEDPWLPTLRRIKGHIGRDGIERISTYQVFEALEVPPRRRPSLTVRLSRAMRRLGWSNVRARGLRPSSYLDRVRGYARPLPSHAASAKLLPTSAWESPPSAEP